MRLKNKMKRVILFSFIIIGLISAGIKMMVFKEKDKISKKEMIELIRNFQIGEGVIDEINKYCDKKGIVKEEYFSALFIEKNFRLKKKDIKKVDIKKYANNNNEEFKLISELCKPILNDIKVFPVPVNSDVTEEYVYYEDSFNKSRTYGGDHRHEGCDIMAEINERGKYPVVSMTSGTIEDIGWLELGGYRIGIRSENGGYFYYAHLYDYAPNLKEGDNVYAGQYIGTMGDSGYSKVEGTVGNFNVHLHVAIYITVNNTEYSINPYYILKNLRTMRAKY